MRSLTAFLKQFFGSMIWVFFILIIGFFILTKVREKFSDNVLGRAAGAVEDQIRNN